jgi:hypothetical protein
MSFKYQYKAAKDGLETIGVFESPSTDLVEIQRQLQVELGPAFVIREISLTELDASPVVSYCPYCGARLKEFGKCQECGESFSLLPSAEKTNNLVESEVEVGDELAMDSNSLESDGSFVTENTEELEPPLLRTKLESEQHPKVAKNTPDLLQTKSKKKVTRLDSILYTFLSALFLMIALKVSSHYVKLAIEVERGREESEMLMAQDEDKGRILQNPAKTVDQQSILDALNSDVSKGGGQFERGAQSNSLPLESVAEIGLSHGSKERWRSYYFHGLEVTLPGEPEESTLDSLPPSVEKEIAEIATQKVDAEGLRVELTFVRYRENDPNLEAVVQGALDKISKIPESHNFKSEVEPVTIADSNAKRIRSTIEKGGQALRADGVALSKRSHLWLVTVVAAEKEANEVLADQLLRSITLSPFLGF